MTLDSLFDGLKIEDWPGGIESHHFATNRDSQRHRVNIVAASICREFESLQVVAQHKSRVRRPAFSLRHALNADHGADRMPRAGQPLLRGERPY